MPTVPIEQNRFGIAGLTDAKLQAGDYSGTGLQALGAGLRTLAQAGAGFAESGALAPRGTPPKRDTGHQDNRQGHPHGRKTGEARQATKGGAMGHAELTPDEHQQTLFADTLSKTAWNGLSAGLSDELRTFRALQGMDASRALRDTTDRMTALYAAQRDGLTGDLEREVFTRSAGPRLEQDLAQARAHAAEQVGVEQGRQSALLQQNAAGDAIANAGNPELFGRFLATGVQSIESQAALRGQDPAITARETATFRSGVHRGVIESREDDPVAAATYYALEREGMTAPDLAAVEASLFEPLARALAVRDVEGLLPMRAPGEPDAPLTPEEREAAAQKIAAQDWTEARKGYARDDLTGRGLREDQRRKQTASAAKEAALAAIEQLGPDFTSLTQLPGAIRRDLDEGTESALARQAERNLDPAPIAPQGPPALRLNLMATYQPADFARQDLRLVRDLMAPAEYDAFVRRQQAIGGYPPHGNAVTEQRIGAMAGQPALSAPAFAQDGTDAVFRPIAMMQDGGSFAQDRAVALQRAEDTGRDPAEILRELKGFPARSATKPTASTTRRWEAGPGPEPISAPAPAPAPFLNYLSEGKDELAIKALKKMGSPPGYVVIYSHGVPATGHIVDAAHGEPYTPLKANEIWLALIRKEYKKGTPIILSSCFAANDGEARELSRLTGGVVYAAKAYVTVPNGGRKRYQLTVHTDGYETGAPSGYARFEKGRETPSRLLGLSYDPKTRAWSWQFSGKPAPIGNRVAAPKPGRPSR